MYIFFDLKAKVGARRYARCLQSLGFPVRFNNFRVVNVLGTCSMPWAIKIVNFSEKYKKDASYEPELHPGVTYKLKTPKATLKIFSTGSITVTGSYKFYIRNRQSNFLLHCHIPFINNNLCAFGIYFYSW